MTKIKQVFNEKKWLRAIVFIVIAALLFFYLNQVFATSKSGASKQIFVDFYAAEENSIDAVYLGTSATNRFFITPKAYNDEGYAVYNLATMGMPMLFVPSLIDEVEKTQDPQLYIIELRGVLRDKEDVTDAHIRRVTDSMKNSENKVAAVERALEYTDGTNGVDEGGLAYYIPIVKYHSRLAAGDMNPKEFLFIRAQEHVQGYVLSSSVLNIVKQPAPVEWTDETAPMAPEMEEVLGEVLDKCDELGKDVIFVMAPYPVREGEPEVFNSAINMVEERGYKVLNFNLEKEAEAMGIDWGNDFYDEKHVNYVGAEKYTDYLVEYLKENYDLPDRRGEKGYESWSEGYDEYLEHIEPGLHVKIFE